VPKLASCLQIGDFSGCAPSFCTPHGYAGCYGRAELLEPASVLEVDPLRPASGLY
jgi:hypothetical protein